MPEILAALGLTISLTALGFVIWLLIIIVLDAGTGGDDAGET